jgi:hypothetical protein
MQNAKDTFYTTLQSRLAALNPARTIVLRGLTRPGILVDENELPTEATAAFRLRWTRLQANTASPLPWIAMECTFTYAADGTPGGGGMDRGRLLSAMDAELSAALAQEPHAVPKINYSGAAPVTMATNIFWANPVFEPVITTAERLARTATVQVFAYQEAGEL